MNPLRHLLSLLTALVVVVNLGFWVIFLVLFALNQCGDRMDLSAGRSSP
jgi:hypothetical protein